MLYRKITAFFGAHNHIMVVVIDHSNIANVELAVAVIALHHFHFLTLVTWCVA
jgi:hypothetical protein